MAGQQTIQFAGPSYYLNDRKTAVQRSINLYPMIVEGLGEAAPLVMESTPGLSLVSDTGNAIRNMRNADGRFFVVSGSSLLEFTTGGGYSNLGTIGSSAGFVSMVNGTNQLAIVDGPGLYVLNTDTNVLTTVVSAGWRGSPVVDYLDGYFVFFAPGTDQFYISKADDATSLDPLKFSSADSQPDNIVSMIVRRRELFLLGGRSTEVWINNGGTDFPLSRYQGTPIDVGCVGARAVCGAADTVVWVGKTLSGGPYVYLLNGYQPLRISTQAVEQQLKTSTDITQCRIWTFQDAGSEFVGLWAPGMSTTWVWDAATKLWHEWGELVSESWTNSRVEFTAYFNDEHYAAGGTKLYKMSRDYRDLAGDALVRERTWPHLIGPSFEPVTYHGLELRCTTGDATSGSITLEVSNDGGAVYGSPLRKSLGDIGRRQQRVRWMPLGTCPAGGSRVHRLRCSDAVPLTMHGATLS